LENVAGQPRARWPLDVLAIAVAIRGTRPVDRVVAVISPAGQLSRRAKRRCDRAAAEQQAAADSPASGGSTAPGAAMLRRATSRIFFPPCSINTTPCISTELRTDAAQREARSAEGGLTVRGPCSPSVLGFHDATADEPVRRRHDHVDGASRGAPRVLTRGPPVAEEMGWSYSGKSSCSGGATPGGN
jgi:hypothetical protein